MRRLLAGLILPSLLLIAWEILGLLQILPEYLATPSAVAAALAELAREDELSTHLRASLWRAGVGFGLGAALGATIGLLAGVVRPVRHFVEPLVSMLYPIPKIAFLPVLIPALGLGHGSKIAIIGLAVFFPTFLSALYAATSVPRAQIWAAQAMGASAARRFFRVLLPASLPQLFSGLRVGLGLAFIVLFAAELMGARDGLGYLVVSAETGLRFDMMLAAVLVIGVLGFIADRVLLTLRKRLLRGQALDKEGGLA